jgi:hypothetical protein
MENKKFEENMDIERDAVNAKAVAQPIDVVLKVVDAPFDGSQPDLRLESFKGQDLKDALNKLPKHEQGARIFEFTIDEHKDDRYKVASDGPVFPDDAPESILVSFITQAYTEKSSWPQLFHAFKTTAPTAQTLSPDSSTVLAQWNQDIKSTEIPHGFSIRSTYKVKSFLFGLSFQDFNGKNFLTTSSSHIFCFRDGEEKLIVLIVNESQADQVSYSSLGFNLEHNRCSTTLIKHTGWSAFGNQSIEQFTKLVLLDFLLTCLYLQETGWYNRIVLPERTTNFGNLYEPGQDPQVFMIAPTHQKHPYLALSSFLPRMVNMLSDCENILENIETTVESILFILRNLSQDHGTQSTLATNSKGVELSYRKKILALTELCETRRRYAKRKLQQIARLFEYQNASSNILQANSVKRLTILASVFVPISVAASILGMQTRFVDLHLLLYDLLGVTVILFTIMVLLFFFIRIDFYWKEFKGYLKPWFIQAQHDHYLFSKYSSWRYWGALRKLTWLTALAITLTSFIVGMILNATLGAKILGYGLVSLFGITVITTAIIIVYEVVQIALWYK